MSGNKIRWRDVGLSCGILDRLDPGKWRTSTKIEALVEELQKLQAEDHSWVQIFDDSVRHGQLILHNLGGTASSRSSTRNT